MVDGAGGRRSPTSFRSTTPSLPFRGSGESDAKDEMRNDEGRSEAPRGGLSSFVFVFVFALLPATGFNRLMVSGRRPRRALWPWRLGAAVGRRAGAWLLLPWPGTG